MKIQRCRYCGHHIKEGKFFCKGHASARHYYFMDICWCGKITYGNRRFCCFSHNLDAIEKNRNAHIGKSSWNKGLTKETDERVKNNADKLKGKKRSKEVRQKNSEWHLGKPTWNKNKKCPQLSGKNHWSFTKKFTSESIEKMRISHLGQKPSPKVGTSKGGWYESKNNGKIWLRSSYELALAKYYDEHNILWFYECKKFKLSNGTAYYPDFYLPDLDLYIEVKGYMMPKAKIKIDMFKKEYVDVKLDIYYYDDLIKLGCKVIR